jgi:hypothetical protein
VSDFPGIHAKTVAKLFLEEGWTVECENPLELRHEDGSVATGRAAQMLIDKVREMKPCISTTTQGGLMTAFGVATVAAGKMGPEDGAALWGTMIELCDQAKEDIERCREICVNRRNDLREIAEFDQEKFDREYPGLFPAEKSKEADDGQIDYGFGQCPKCMHNEHPERCHEQTCGKIGRLTKENEELRAALRLLNDGDSETPDKETAE